MERPLEMLSDVAGGIVFGWVGRGVLYCKLIDRISPELGAKFEQRLPSAFVGKAQVHCYVDVSSPGSLDLSGQSAIIRAMIAERRRLRALTIAAGSPAAAAIARVLSNVLDGVSVTLSEAGRFNADLAVVGPLARQKLRAGASGGRSKRPRPGHG
jgi:hypothetical protein